MSTVLEFDVTGMHCGSCALLIDDALADLPGVINSRTSVKNARASVYIEPAQLDESAIVTAVAELGYQATPVPR